MPVSVGDQLGPYEILSPIGAGGMGEVWKARDTRLDRIVAIKTSKAPFSDRFAREAKAIAALNHPHICQLYDVGPDYLVMEYIEGTPLQGPLAENKAIEYAGQILSALEAAHQKGVIHRDLKPANILVTKHHGIKLLDFGLARTVSGSIDSTLTNIGEQIGTPAYMAPEQWQGKPTDARTDIYSFGSVLYEMLAGKRATEEPRAALPSPVLDSIVRTCMERAPEDRWQSASDIRRVMLIPAVPMSNARRTWPWIAVALLVLTTGLMLVGRSLNRSPVPGDVVTFDIYPPEHTVFSTIPTITVSVPQFALAPNGRMLVFCAGAEGQRALLWRRSLDNLDAQPLLGTEDAQDPFWSPDGRWIGFFADGKLKTVPADGGAVQVIVPMVKDVRGGTWGAGDTILFSDGIGPIQRVPATGGQPSAVTTVSPDESGHAHPRFLPNGRNFLYHSRGLTRPNAMYIGSVDQRTSKLVLHNSYSAVYAAPGYLLFVNGTDLFAQSFDLAHLRTSGQQFIIAQHAGHTTTFRSAVSTSGNGVIAYAGTVSPNGSLTWIDRSGRHLNTTGPEAFYSDFRLSPDQNLLAASVVDSRTGIVEIWMTDLTRGSTTRVGHVDTDNTTLNATPIWSPDGKYFAFRINKGTLEFHQKSAAGGGDEKVLLSQPTSKGVGIQSNNLVNTDWSPDGTRIMFSVPGPDSGQDLWLLPLVGDKKPIKYLVSPADEMHGNFSPDGRLVAYTSNDSGRFEVNVQTLPLSERKWQVSTSGGYEPRWRQDGREIYYLSEDRKLMAVPVGPGPSFGIPRVLFQTQVPPGVAANHTHYVPSRDGQRFLVNTLSPNQSPTRITVVLNWTSGLKK